MLQRVRIVQAFLVMSLVALARCQEPGTTLPPTASAAEIEALYRGWVAAVTDPDRDPAGFAEVMADPGLTQHTKYWTEYCRGCPAPVLSTIPDDLEITIHGSTATASVVASTSSASPGFKPAVLHAKGPAGNLRLDMVLVYPDAVPSLPIPDGSYAEMSDDTAAAIIAYQDWVTRVDSSDAAVPDQFAPGPFTDGYLDLDVFPTPNPELAVDAPSVEVPPTPLLSFEVITETGETFGCGLTRTETTTHRVDGGPLSVDDFGDLADQFDHSETYSALMRTSDDVVCVQYLPDAPVEVVATELYSIDWSATPIEAT